MHQKGISAPIVPIISFMQCTCKFLGKIRLSCGHCFTPLGSHSPHCSEEKEDPPLGLLLRRPRPPSLRQRRSAAQTSVGRWKEQESEWTRTTWADGQLSGSKGERPDRHAVRREGLNILDGSTCRSGIKRTERVILDPITFRNCCCGELHHMINDSMSMRVK